MKVLVYIGPSGSGKTTHILNNYFNDEFVDTKFNNIDISSDGKTLLFGKYKQDKRCLGCDTLSMSIIDDLLKTLEMLIIENKYETIILDGDRITNDKMFQFLIKYKDITEIIYMNTEESILYDRLKECNKQFVKTTIKKSYNMYLKLKHERFNIKEIATKNNRWF